MSKLFAAVLAGAALSLATVSVVSAQTAAPAAKAPAATAPSASTTTATAATPPAAAAADVPAKYNIDTPIETIVANTDAKAVLDKVVPGLTSHPQYEAFKGLSLTQLAPYSEGKITEDVLKAAKAALAAVKS